MKNIVLLISLFFGLVELGVAQNTEGNLRLFAKFTEQGVELKVAPQTGSVWIIGAEFGYNYFRRKAGQSDFVQLNSTPVLPWSKEKIASSQFENNDSLQAFQQTSIFDQIDWMKGNHSPFEVVQYKREFEQNYAFYFLLTTRFPEISMISGLEFIDPNVVAGESYEYKVELVKKESDLDVSVCDVYTEQNSLPLPILDGYEGEKLIDLAWRQVEDSYVLSYYVEKSADSLDFERLTDTPIYLNTGDSDSIENNMMFYSDSLIQNYVPHQYRLVGVDVWGDETRPSLAMTYMGRDRTAPELPDSIWVESFADTRSLKLKWIYQNSPGDLAGSIVYHADSVYGITTALNEELLPAETSEMDFGEVIPASNHYFQLVVQDTAGNFASSRVIYGYLPDLYPPVAPQNVTAIIDSLGVVKLKWEPNKEADLIGYAVYRSNGRNLRMIKISGYPVEEALFEDTLSLKRLNKETYYSVMALDASFNYSEYSELIKVVIPDTIPPASPGLMKAEFHESSLSLSWIPSVSEDVKVQYVLSLDDRTSIIDTLASLSEAETTMAMDWEQKGQFYFAIQVADQDGNVSELGPKCGLYIEDNQDVVVSSLKARKRNDGVGLSWKISGNSSLQSRVYRKKENASSVYLEQTYEMKYTDTTSLANGSYFYYICLVDEFGVEQVSSDRVKIEVKGK